MKSAIDSDDEDKFGTMAMVLPVAVAGFVLATACWSLFAVVGIHVRTILDLNSVQFGLLLSVPMASGALAAIPGGLAAQLFGARRVMIACLAGLALSMLVLIWADSFGDFLLAGVGLGMAGGYYSAGLQFVTRHAPRSLTGTALGLFGAGITGFGGSYYLAPRVLEAFSWSTVPLAYLIMLTLIVVLMVLLTSDERDDAGLPLAPLRWVWRRLSGVALWQGAAWFGVVAGSFLALALWLPEYLVSEYHLPMESGAGMAQWFVVPGALAQIPGGFLADRFGSARVAVRALLVCVLMLFLLSYPPMTLFIEGKEGIVQIELVLPLALVIALIVTLGVAMGFAMAGLQRLVVGQNREFAALAGGILLVSACSVAFALPLSFGVAYAWIGVRSAVFMIVFVLFSISLFLFARSARRYQRETLLHPGI